jgi:hypothetical protein
MKNNNNSQSPKHETALRRFINTFFSAKLEFRVRLFNVLALAGTAVAFFIGFSWLITEQNFVITLIDWASAALVFGLYGCIIYTPESCEYRSE